MIDDPELTADQILALRRAVIDSSTLIYLHAAGVLDHINGVLQLETTAGVADEVSRPPAGFTLPEWISIATGSSGVTVDQSVLERALERGTALLSDDRKLLMAADDAKIPYYNAACVLQLLLLRRRLTIDSHDAAWARMMAAARYSPPVLAAARALHWEARKRL